WEVCRRPEGARAGPQENGNIIAPLIGDCQIGLTVIIEITSRHISGIGICREVLRWLKASRSARPVLRPRLGGDANHAKRCENQSNLSKFHRRISTCKCSSHPGLLHEQLLPGFEIYHQGLKRSCKDSRAATDKTMQALRRTRSL